MRRIYIPKKEYGNLNKFQSPYRWEKLEGSVEHFHLLNFLCASLISRSRRTGRSPLRFRPGQVLEIWIILRGCSFLFWNEILEFVENHKKSKSYRESVSQSSVFVHPPFQPFFTLAWSWLGLLRGVFAIRPHCPQNSSAHFQIFLSMAEWMPKMGMESEMWLEENDFNS